jgi:hypothetical protein
MKRRKTLPFVKFWRKIQQRGQAIVEFVLLLVVISGISYGFVTFMTRNIGRYWTYYANLVVDDKPGTKSLRKN